jgi:hypothetical protein
VRGLLAFALLTAAACATWLAWIAYELLCEEGCAGRPWPLVAQLIIAWFGLAFAAVAAYGTATGAHRRARTAAACAAAAYLVWAVLLLAAV